MKKIHCIYIWFLLQTVLFGQPASMLDKAGEAFLEGDLDRAKSLYLNVLESQPANGDIYRNLGYIYERQNELHTAISYYQKGIPYAGKKLGEMYRNLGAAYYKLGDFGNAEKMYSSGISAVPPEYNCYRDRGNTRVKLGKYEGALSDYQTYLSLRPDAPQKQQIEQMISLLSTTIDEAEALRLAEEARKLEEEEKQRKLLESVLDSLNEVSDETQNLSAGSEDVEEPDIDLELVD